MLLKRLNKFLITGFLTTMSLTPVMAELEASDPELTEVKVSSSSTMDNLKEFLHFQKNIFMAGMDARFRGSWKPASSGRNPHD